MTSGVCHYHCLGRACEIYAGCKPRDWPEAIAVIPDQCAHPERCTHGSCRQVAETYLRGMAARLRTIRDLT